MMARKNNKIKNTAFLTAYDKYGGVVCEQKMSIDEYYDGLHDLIDNDEFRSQRGVIKITGKLYDHEGVLVQQLENEYLPNVAFLKGTASNE